MFTGEAADVRIQQIKDDLNKRFPTRLAILLKEAIDWIHEHVGQEKALEEAEYLHTLGSTQIEPNHRSWCPLNPNYGHPCQCKRI